MSQLTKNLKPLDVWGWTDKNISEKTEKQDIGYRVSSIVPCHFIRKDVMSRVIVIRMFYHKNILKNKTISMELKVFKSSTISLKFRVWKDNPRKKATYWTTNNQSGTYDRYLFIWQPLTNSISYSVTKYLVHHFSGHKINHGDIQLYHVLNEIRVLLQLWLWTSNTMSLIFIYSCEHSLGPVLVNFLSA